MDPFSKAKNNLKESVVKAYVLSQSIGIFMDGDTKDRALLDLHDARIKVEEDIRNYNKERLIYLSQVNKDGADFSESIIDGYAFVNWVLRRHVFNISLAV